jgi:hypothetical protein
LEWILNAVKVLVLSCANFSDIFVFTYSSGGSSSVVIAPETADCNLIIALKHLPAGIHLPAWLVIALTTLG